MNKDNKTLTNINYLLEINREVKRLVRFLIKELDHFQSKEHVEEIIGEILYISSTCRDDKTKAYIDRKLKELSLRYPDLIQS
ncbi:MAG: hypothetical protein ACTSWN_11485 [Promethearchaeota archaeon]